MGDITVDGLRETVERVSKNYKNRFLKIRNLFVAEDDYSSPKVKKAGLKQRPEKLIACNFSTNFGNRRISIGRWEYLDRNLEQLTASIISFTDDEQNLLEKNLSKFGLSWIPYPELEPVSLKTVENFLIGYFESELQIREYYKKKAKFEENINSLKNKLIEKENSLKEKYFG